jgi:hypothetical protein
MMDGMRIGDGPATATHRNEDRMQRRCTLAVVFLTLYAGRAAMPAAELLPPDRPLPEVVDHYIDARLAEKNVTPAPPAEEAILLRRTMLDLVGRIPTIEELRAYQADTDLAKREKLVDALLASDGYVRQQTDELYTLLMYPERRDRFREYLATAVKENRAWDQLFRELMLIDGQASAPEHSHEFLRGLVNDADKMTNEVSVKFFGVNVSCAKCHDHPLVGAWTQDHYYGMKSFFDRTFESEGAIGEREYGLVKYKPIDGDEREAKLMFLTGEVLSEPEQKTPTDDDKKREKEQLEQLRKNKQPPPAAQYSRRKRIVEAGLGPGGREFFSRAIANRLFNRFYGSGLVMPLDQLHDENPPTHPELLAWIARDLADHGYDLKRTIRGLVLSRAYARDSRWTSGDRPSSGLYAVAAVRPLTPRQLAASLKIALLDSEQLAKEMAPAQAAKRIDERARGSEGMAERFEVPGEDFQVGVDEALYFSNHQDAENEVERGGLFDALRKLDDPQRIERAYQNVLLRSPDDEERQAMGAYLSQRTDRRDEATRQLVWALVTSTEFRFNY